MSPGRPGGLLAAETNALKVVLEGAKHLQLVPIGDAVGVAAS